MKKGRRVLSTILVSLSLLLAFGIFTSAFAEDEDSANNKIKAAFMDAKDTIYVSLKSPVKISGKNAGTFSLKQDGKIPVELKSAVTGYQAITRDAWETGFDVTTDKKTVRFMIGQGGSQDFPINPKGDEEVYVVGDMNNWCGLRNGGKFTPDAAWKMTWNASAECFELVKQIGASVGEVAFDAKFQFVQVLNAKKDVKYYPNSELEVSDFTAVTDFIKITLAKEVDPVKEYVLSFPGLDDAYIVKRSVLDADEFNYTGDDLGANYASDKTYFRVWTPAAQAVSVVLYDTDTVATGKEIQMLRDIKGTWKAEVKGDIKNKFYTYKVQINGKLNEAVDPYAKALGINGNRGAVVDLSETNPGSKGFFSWLFSKKTKRPEFKNPEDAIIYEMHVRDFTINPTSGAKNRGKYLGFAEVGTKGPNGVATGIDHLKELGITHVQIMPAYDYATVDETAYNPEKYNWGYDPKNFNAPEGSYASDPSSPTARIKEFKTLINALHENGIRAIMDVVYNHTFTTKDSWFDLIVPQYYYRTDSSGDYTNGSGCGNELASERPMVRKFMLDSVKYWVNEYGVDGFRFDLMGVYDTVTMSLVEKELHKIDPTIIIYGEPWTGGTSGLDQSKRIGKGVQKNMHLAVFNDNFRDAIKGDLNGGGLGFANGQKGMEEGIRRGVTATIDDFIADPEESINYISAHDNACLWDKISFSRQDATLEDRKKMDMLAASIILTSQGIPFMYGGDEMLRTKDMVTDSYRSPDNINNVNWQWKVDNHDVFEYYRGLIALRKAHPAFRMTTAEQIRENLHFIDSPENTVAYVIANNANDDAWKNIVVIFNPNKEEVKVNLPETGEWTVIVDADEAGITKVKTGTATFSNSVVVSGLSTMVLYKN